MRRVGGGGDDGLGGGGRRGAALVIVLLLIAVLTVIVAEFVYQMRVQTALLKNHESKVIARSVAKAGQNAAEGLLVNTKPDNEGVFNNELIQLFQYSCISTTPLAGTGESGSGPADRDDDDDEEEDPFTGMEGCGTWSLSIPYVLVDTPIDINIYDEQSRLNINALMKMSGAPQAADPGQPAQPDQADVSMTRNEWMFNSLFELFRYEIMIHQLEISDQDLIFMLTALADYLDYGMVDGTFDDDRINYFEYEDDDRIVPMKNGPLDTVDEIRYLPGMTDELYAAVSPFLTVYPGNYDNDQFIDKINFNAAPVEVLYAIYRATSYKDGEAQLTEEEAYQKAVETIQGAAADPAAAAPAPPTGAGVSTVKPYKRIVAPACLSNNLCAGFQMPEGQNPRFYRIKSTAITGDGLETSITRVVRYDGRVNGIDTVYYLEQ